MSMMSRARQESYRLQKKRRLEEESSVSGTIQSKLNSGKSLTVSEKMFAQERGLRANPLSNTKSSGSGSGSRGSGPMPLPKSGETQTSYVNRLASWSASTGKTASFKDERGRTLQVTPSGQVTGSALTVGTSSKSTSQIIKEKQESGLKLTPSEQRFVERVELEKRSLPAKSEPKTATPILAKRRPFDVGEARRNALGRFEAQIRPKSGPLAFGSNVLTPESPTTGTERAFVNADIRAQERQYNAEQRLEQAQARSQMNIDNYQRVLQNKIDTGEIDPTQAATMMQRKIDIEDEKLALQSQSSSASINRNFSSDYQSGLDVAAKQQIGVMDATTSGIGKVQRYGQKMDFLRGRRAAKGDVFGTLLPTIGAAGSGFVMAPVALFQIAKHPIQTGEVIVRDPFGVGSQIRERAINEPGQFLGEIAFFGAASKGLGAASKGLGRTNPNLARPGSGSRVFQRSLGSTPEQIPIELYSQRYLVQLEKSGTSMFRTKGTGIRPFDRTDFMSELGTQSSVIKTRSLLGRSVNIEQSITGSQITQKFFNPKGKLLKTYSSEIASKPVSDSILGKSSTDISKAQTGNLFAQVEKSAQKGLFYSRSGRDILSVDQITRKTVLNKVTVKPGYYAEVDILSGDLKYFQEINPRVVFGKGKLKIPPKDVIDIDFPNLKLTRQPRIGTFTEIGENVQGLGAIRRMSRLNKKAGLTAGRQSLISELELGTPRTGSGIRGGTLDIFSVAGRQASKARFGFIPRVVQQSVSLSKAQSFSPFQQRFQRFNLSSKPFTFLDVAQTPVNLQRISQRPVQQTFLRQQTFLDVLPFTSPSPFPGFNTNITAPGGSGFSPGITPILDALILPKGGRKGRGKGSRSRVKRGYVPDIAALIYGQKGPKQKGLFTGVERRLLPSRSSSTRSSGKTILDQLNSMAFDRGKKSSTRKRKGKRRSSQPRARTVLSQLNKMAFSKKRTKRRS